MGEAPEVFEALLDDLNTPRALAALHALATEANKAGDPAERASVKGALLAGGELMGLLGQEPRAWLQSTAAGTGAEDLDGGEIERLIEARGRARRERNFGEADRIRDDLAARGIVLQDGPQGTTWRRAS